MLTSGDNDRRWFLSISSVELLQSQHLCRDLARMHNCTSWYCCPLLLPLLLLLLLLLPLLPPCCPCCPCCFCPCCPCCCPCCPICCRRDGMLVKIFPKSRIPPGWICRAFSENRLSASSQAGALSAPTYVLSEEASMATFIAFHGVSSLMLFVNAKISLAVSQETGDNCLRDRGTVRRHHSAAAITRPTRISESIPNQHAILVMTASTAGSRPRIELIWLFNTMKAIIVDPIATMTRRRRRSLKTRDQPVLISG